MEKYEEQIKKFGMYKRLDDSQQFLLDHTHLACEFTANYLVIWCIDLEEEGVLSYLCFSLSVSCCHLYLFSVKIGISYKASVVLSFMIARFLHLIRIILQEGYLWEISTHFSLPKPACSIEETLKM